MQTLQNELALTDRGWGGGCPSGDPCTNWSLDVDFQDEENGVTQRGQKCLARPAENMYKRLTSDSYKLQQRLHAYT